MEQHQEATATERARGEEVGAPIGVGLLGAYTVGQVRREVRAVITADGDLCVIDRGPNGALLVEPDLEGIAQARALAADYVELATEHGEPQTRLPWPPAEAAGETS